MIRVRLAVAALALAALTESASAQLITNGGFETGDLTGWVPFSPPGSCFAGVGSGQAHSGTYEFMSGPVGGTCTLSQSFATTVGTQYTFSFWVQNLGAGTPNSFEARWGTTSFTIANSAVFAYTQLMLVVTADAPTSTISFEIRHDPSFYLVDDVAVVEGDVSQLSTVPEPSTYALMAVGLLGIVGARRRRRA